MKVIGKVKLIKVEQYTRKDGTIGYRCVGMTDENEVTVFYRPDSETPATNSEYVQVLAYDRNLSAVVRYPPAPEK